MGSSNKLSILYFNMVLFVGLSTSSFSQIEITSYIGLEISDETVEHFGLSLINDKSSISPLVGFDLYHNPENHTFGVSLGFYYSRLRIDTEDYAMDDKGHIYTIYVPPRLNMHRFRFNTDVYLPMSKWKFFTGTSLDYSVDNDESEHIWNPYYAIDKRLQLSLRLGLLYSLNKINIKAVYNYGFASFNSNFLTTGNTYQLMIGYTLFERDKKK